MNYRGVQNEYGPTMSSIINRLYEHYQMEGLFMSYTIEDYIKETQQQVLNSLTLEEILKGRSPQEVAKAFPVEELIKALPIEEMEKYLIKMKQ